MTFHHKQACHVHVIVPEVSATIAHFDADLELIWDPSDPWRIEAQLDMTPIMSTNPDGSNEIARWNVSVEQFTNTMHGELTSPEIKDGAKAAFVKSDDVDFLQFFGHYQYADGEGVQSATGYYQKGGSIPLALYAGFYGSEELERLLSTITINMPSTEHRDQLIDDELNRLLYTTGD